MAKKPSSRWQEALPSTYETILEGFHARMTVAEFAKRFSPDTMIPKDIQKIQIGSFTPDTFDDPALKDFWQTPIDPATLSPATMAALKDPDIVAVQQNACDYTINPEHPTLEMLARVAQTQYMGFQVRMCEMTSVNLFNRLEKFQDPAAYNDFRSRFRQSSVVKSNSEITDSLPEKMPYFEATRQEFSVKSVESAVSKAYGRSGKPKNTKAFYKDPERYGINAVSDMQRTSLAFSKSDRFDPRTAEYDYKDVRNVITALLISGELGVVVDGVNDEIVDQVLYPPSPRLSDQYPVFKAKGTIYHAGPQASMLTAPVELQIAFLSEDDIKESHQAYECRRNTTMLTEEGRAERAYLDEQRQTIFERRLTPSIMNTRYDFLKIRKVPAVDALYALTQNAAAMQGLRGGAIKRANEVAFKEFPNDERNLRGKIYAFDPFVRELGNNGLRRATRDIISRSFAINANDALRVTSETHIPGPDRHSKPRPEHTESVLALR